MLLAINSVSHWQELLRLGVAAGLGGVVGIEREMRDREAGIRTHLLVSMGAALFTLISAYGFSSFGSEVDPTRIAAQIVTGIGFLGAGAIISTKFSIRGLTTAASLWIVAAIGMACGAGYWWPAVATTVIVVIALGPLRLANHVALSPFHRESGVLTLTLRPGTDFMPILHSVGEVRHLEVHDDSEQRVVTVDLDAVDEKLVSALAAREDVTEVLWRR